MIPMSGNLIQITLCHKRRPRADITPFFILQVLDPALQLHDHFGSLRHKKRKSLADHVHCRKQFHLASKPVMVAALCVLQLFQMCRKLFFFIERCSINTLQTRF